MNHFSCFAFLKKISFIVNFFSKNTTLFLKRKKMLKAQYGCLTTFQDVTFLLREAKDQTIDINNVFFQGDPLPGFTKYLCMDFGHNKRHYVAEHGTLTLNDVELSGEFKEQKKDALVTFIIPTIGRKSLCPVALKSLLNLSSSNWEAIVVFDGDSFPEELKDSVMKMSNNIRIMTPGKKVGFSNCAGEVRNSALSQVKTEWIAFLDDDDEVTMDYVYRLEQESHKNPHSEVIVFRMLDMNEVRPRSAQIILHEVGISFAIKTHVMTNQAFKFIPCCYEDFNLLNRLLQAGKNIHVSQHITYIVRPPFVS
jgi:Glycosyl transferase family 2